MDENMFALGKRSLYAKHIVFPRILSYFNSNVCFSVFFFVRKKCIFLHFLPQEIDFTRVEKERARKLIVQKEHCGFQNRNNWPSLNSGFYGINLILSLQPRSTVLDEKERILLSAVTNVDVPFLRKKRNQLTSERYSLSLCIIIYPNPTRFSDDVSNKWTWKLGKTEH